MEKERDREYYEMLGLAVGESDKGAIKKAYYAQAMRYHPDKNPNDPHAEEMFKLVSEAYQVLYDDNKRELYNKFGKEGVKTEEQGGPSIVLMYKMMFGGGQFDDVFGELKLVEQMVMMEEKKPVFSKEERDKKVLAEGDNLRRLIQNLQHKLALFVSGQVEDFNRAMAEDIQEKLEAPGGPSLLAHIGYVYSQESAKQLGVIGGFFASMSEIGHQFSMAFGILGEVVKLGQLSQQVQENESGVTTEMQEKIMNQTLTVVWRLGKMEIESLLRNVCGALVLDISDQQEQKKILQGLKLLGSRYQQAAKLIPENLRKNAPTMADIGIHTRSEPPKDTEE